MIIVTHEKTRKWEVARVEQSEGNKWGSWDLTLIDKRLWVVCRAEVQRGEKRQKTTSTTQNKHGALEPKNSVSVESQTERREKRRGSRDERIEKEERVKGKKS